MRTAEIELPSGLSGVVRNWKMGELSVFTSKAMIRKPGPAIEAQLMKHAWTETTNTGPYSFTKSPPWMSTVATGDLFEAIRQVRILTWGVEMDLDLECKRRRCDEDIPVTIHLDELELKPFNDDALAIFAADNRFTHRLSGCGREVTFGISTGAAQVRADMLAKEFGRDLVAVRASCIAAVEGIDKPNSKKFWQFVSDLDADDGMELGDAMDEVEPGVETDVDCDCEECGCHQTHTVPFGADFFMPEKRARTRTETKDAKKRIRIPELVEEEEEEADSDVTPT